jgi:hypothetical protein
VQTCSQATHAGNERISVVQFGYYQFTATTMEITSITIVYLPIRNDDGSISGFIGFADGQLKMPPQWIQTNVVKLKRA